MSDEEKAINLLRSADIDETGDAQWHTWYKGIDKDIKKAFDVAIKALEQEQRWIPVSERLPKRNGYYLVTGRQGAVNKRLYQDGHWYGNWAILAWMPLPQPYKAESEEV